MSTAKQLRRIAAVVGLLAAGSASATLITHQAVAGNQIIAGGPVPLLGMTSLPFFNFAGQRFVVTFSAECAVNAPAGNTTTYTDIDIEVLNAAGVLVQVLTPTVFNSDAFCTANGTAGFDGWVRPSATVVGGVGLPQGDYRVRVRARVNGAAGATASYGERALIVSR
jgi:hypothetical protein